MIERIIDIVAHELGFDPVELRKRNYVQPEDYPYETPNGCVYDSGDLPRSLDIALELIDVEKWRELASASSAAARGKRIGIGIGSTLDSGTNNFGQARIINPDLPFSGNGEAAYVKLDLYGEVDRQPRHDAAGAEPRDDRRPGGGRHPRREARPGARHRRLQPAAEHLRRRSRARTPASSPSPG